MITVCETQGLGRLSTGGDNLRLTAFVDTSVDTLVGRLAGPSWGVLGGLKQANERSWTLSWAPSWALSCQRPPKGQKNGAARKLSKSVEELFDTF